MNGFQIKWKQQFLCGYNFIQAVNERKSLPDYFEGSLPFYHSNERSLKSYLVKLKVTEQ